MQGHSYSASTVLVTDSDIGACYPVSIKEKSRITVRLAYPVLLTGFTVGLNHCGSTAPLVNSTDLSIAVEGFQPYFVRRTDPDAGPLLLGLDSSSHRQ